MTAGEGTASLRSRMIGTWELVSRIDVTAAGERRIDPLLGADPVAQLQYDAGGRFAAQFMRRDRRADVDADTASPVAPSANNPRARGGYDAYFGTYEVDEASGLVTQTLLGALSPENVGMVVTRALTVEGDSLTVSLATTAHDGTPVTRTLTWRRVA